MEYLEFLEHARTLLDAWSRVYPSDLKTVIDAEIEAERQRGDLALKLSGDPFLCTQCGDPIMYGERQHVCRGGK